MESAIDPSRASELLAGSAGHTEANVPTEHLDYGYVDTCTDASELRAILAALRSGRDGRYPQLEAHTEARLLSVLPARERDLYVAQHFEPPPVQVAAARDDIKSWLEAMESGVKPAAAARSSIPAARGTSTAAPPPTSTAPARVEPTSTVKRDSKAEPFYSYYKRWDDFAAKETDDEVQVAATTTSSSSTSSSSTSTAPVATPSTSTAARAETARLAGNAAFKSGDETAALAHYSESLRLDGSSSHAAIVYSNRAQVYLNRGDLDAAAADADAAVRVDPLYLKSFVRRAAVHNACGRFAAAVDDFNSAIRLEPDGPLVPQLKSALEVAKRAAADSKPAKRRIAILEETADEAPPVAQSSSRRMVITTSTAVAVEAGLTEATVQVIPPAVQVVDAAVQVDLAAFHRFKSAGDAAMQSKSYAQALEAYSAAVSQPFLPHHLSASVYSNSALAQFKLGSWSNAITAARNAIDAAFKSISAPVSSLSQALDDLNPEIAQALEDAGVARVMVKALYRYAAACVETGETVEARRATGAALRLEPHNDAVRALHETIAPVTAAVPEPRPTPAPPTPAAPHTTSTAAAEVKAAPSPTSTAAAAVATSTPGKPRTHAEFERSVASLSRSGPSPVFKFVRAHMLACLADFKRPLEPDAFSSILAALHACAAPEDADWLRRALPGMLGTPGARTTVALLTEAERSTLRALAATAAYSLPPWAA